MDAQNVGFAVVRWLQYVCLAGWLGVCDVRVYCVETAKV